jgi:hypothetical protein
MKINHLHDDGLGSVGLSADSFAYYYGLSRQHVIKLCEQSFISPARKHPVTKQWWIYPPATFKSS